jgi:hypothetical protein
MHTLSNFQHDQVSCILHTYTHTYTHLHTYTHTYTHRASSPTSSMCRTWPDQAVCPWGEWCTEACSPRCRSPRVLMPMAFQITALSLATTSKRVTYILVYILGSKQINSKSRVSTRPTVSLSVILALRKRLCVFDSDTDLERHSLRCESRICAAHCIFDPDTDFERHRLVFESVYVAHCIFDSDSDFERHCLVLKASNMCFDSDSDFERHCLVLKASMWPIA